MGNTIVCIASGPSLTKEDVDYCRGKARVLVVSDNYLIAPWADWLYACDYRWWKLHAQRSSETFQGERWTRDPEASKEFHLRWIQSIAKPGLSKNPNVIHEGENTGFQGINLSYHFKPKKIILLGYDMTKGHWFGEHPTELREKSDFRRFIPAFTALAEDLKTEGIEVVNCSRLTELTCFRRSRIVDEL